jgi:hypothetical protein
MTALLRIAVVLLVTVALGKCSETVLNFELEEKSTECFVHDVVLVNESIAIEFLVCTLGLSSLILKVLFGGRRDVDVAISLDGARLFEAKREKTGRWSFRATRVCVS